MGGHRRPGDQGIGQRPGEGRYRRPLLDRIAQRQGGHQGQGAAQADEQDARHQADVQPRNSQEMGQAGIADGRHDLDRDSAPRARHQGGGDGARGAVEARQNAFRDALAQPFQGETEGGGPFDARTLLDGGGAEREADGAELAEKGLALEVEGAGRGGRRRRREDGAQADPVAGGETRLVAGQAQARPFRRLDRGKGRDAQAIEGDAAGPGQDLDGDDPADDADRAKAMVENRRRDEDRPPLDGGEAEGEDAERQGRYQGHRAAAIPARPSQVGGSAGRAK